MAKLPNIKKQKQIQDAKRRKLREELFPDSERPWLSHEETGYFSAPRSLPLLLDLLKSKEIRGKNDPSTVYIELLSRHMGQGIVELTYEEEHAFAAGYHGERATHTWRERMRVLEDIGLIRTKKKGNRRYAYVLLVHPTIVIQRLYDKGKVDPDWWTTFRSLQIETKEPTAEELLSSWPQEAA